MLGVAFALATQGAGMPRTVVFGPLKWTGRTEVGRGDDTLLFGKAERRNMSGEAKWRGWTTQCAGMPRTVVLQQRRVWLCCAQYCFGYTK